MRLVGFSRRITFCDRDLELRRLYCVIEVLEFPDPGNGVISGQYHTASLPWRWFDAVRMSHPSVWSKRIEALPECVAAGKSEHAINSLGRKSARTIVDVDDPLAIDDRIGTHLSHQFRALYPGGRSKYASATQLGKLNRQCADAARGAMNDDCLTPP